MKAVLLNQSSFLTLASLLQLLKMAEGSDNTALLADTDHLESHDDVCSQGILPAKSHFKFTTRLLTLLISLLSLATFILLIVTYIRVKSGPFGYVGRTQDTINDLSICVSHLYYLSMCLIFKMLSTTDRKSVV